MSEASKPKKKGLPATTPTSPKNETVNSPSRVKKSKVNKTLDCLTAKETLK
jgi:hypothetical protein